MEINFFFRPSSQNGGRKEVFAAMTMLPDPAETELFQRYLDICNRALEANKDRFPFRQILSAMREGAEQRPMEVCIIDDRPEASFTIALAENRIVTRDNKACDACGCKGKWRVRRSYLEDVVRNPEAYIRNPARIDWEWMTGEQGD